MENHYLEDLVEELIRSAFNSGKFTQIQDMYRAYNGRINDADGPYSAPSIYQIENQVRDLVEKMANEGSDYEESNGIYVKLEYAHDERSILMFGFKYQADQVYEKPEQINEIKIVDQNGNDFDIVSVYKVDNVTTYKIKALNFAKINFQKNDLFQNYKTEFKKRMFGKDNG